ncbi:hypothetical protein [Paenibacillus sp. AN1007]|uniref:Uncharacterized protein n=1 Tax=Paenibacillus sp. AN1007 TaxID=3151385 RepID=A0AAU8NGT3_9BACL
MYQTYYIKRDKAGYVRDVITYEHEGFERIEYDDMLPIGIMSGCFKWINAEFVFDKARKEELDVITQSTDVLELKNRLDEAENTVKSVAQENAALRMSDLDNKEAIAGLIELVLAGGATNG